MNQPLVCPHVYFFHGVQFFRSRGRIIGKLSSILHLVAIDARVVRLVITSALGISFFHVPFFFLFFVMRRRSLLN